MTDSYFENIGCLLAELCTYFDDNDLSQMVSIGAHMAQDKNFEKLYTAAVKHCYVSNFQAIKSKEYRPKKFTDLNNELMFNINQGLVKPVLLPEYIKYDVDSTDKNIQSDVLQRLSVLKQQMNIK